MNNIWCSEKVWKLRIWKWDFSGHPSLNPYEKEQILQEIFGHFFKSKIKIDRYEIQVLFDIFSKILMQTTTFWN